MNKDNHKFILLLALSFFFLILFSELGSAGIWYGNTSGHGLAQPKGGTANEKIGIAIRIRENITLTNFTIVSGVPDTNAYVYSAKLSGGNAVIDVLLGRVAITNSTPTLSGAFFKNSTNSIGINLSTSNTWNNTFILMTDLGGSLRNMWAHMTPTGAGAGFPINMPQFNFTEGVFNGQICMWAGSCGGNYLSNINTLGYDWLNTTASASTPPVIAFNQQIPTDITSLNVVGGMVIQYNITNANTTTALFYYKTNATSGDNVFINGTARTGYTLDTSLIFNYSWGSNNVFNVTQDDNEVYPASYNLDHERYEYITRNITTLLGSTDGLAIELYNISNTSQYNFFEAMVNKSILGGAGLSVRYCNSSYTTGSFATSTSCTLIGSLASTGTYNHDDSNSSRHQVFPYLVNATTGRIGTVKVTPDKSYFILSGTGWTVFSIPVPSRTTATRTTANNGTTWTNRPTYTTDAHTHMYNNNDTYYYYLCMNSSVDNSQACSTVRSDLISLAGLAPFPGVVTIPTTGIYSQNINITYTAWASPNGYPMVFYNISLLNSSMDIVLSIAQNNSLNLSYLWNSTAATRDGTYYIKVRGYDNMSQSSIAISDAFTISNHAPELLGLYWITTGGLTGDLVYGQVLQNITITATDKGIAPTLNLTVYDGNNNIIVNSLMANVTTTYYYQTPISLLSAGTWTININAQAEGDIIVNSNITFIVNTLVITSVDSWFGYTTYGIPNASDINNAVNNEFNIIEITQNISQLNSALTTEILNLTNYSHAQNMKVGINYLLDMNTTSELSSIQNNITQLLSSFTKDPYYITTAYFSLEIMNESQYTPSEIATSLNAIAQSIVNVTSNKFIVYAKNYNNSLNSQYIKYTVLNYVTPLSSSDWINKEAALARNSSSLNRMYVAPLTATIPYIRNYNTNILRQLRSPININSNLTYPLVGSTMNGDLIVFNNASTRQVYTINSTNKTKAYDVWDSTNGVLLANRNTDHALNVNTSQYSANLLFADTFDHLAMSSYDAATIYKASVPQSKNLNYTNSFTGGSSWNLDGASDALIELYDPTFVSNTFITYYGWINVSKVNLSVANYSVMIIADKNPYEVANLNGLASGKVYGYVSVADYANNEAWITSKQAEVDTWFMVNSSMNIFLDGLDIGNIAAVNFSAQFKRIADYIRITKGKKAILNTYTAYEQFATFGDGIMKESCVNRWYGASNVFISNYTREDWNLEVTRARWFKSKGIPVYCQAFSNASSFVNSVYNYSDMLNIYYASKVLGYQNFYLSQPTFQSLYELRLPDVGTDMANDFSIAADNQTYYRRYSNGIIYYNISNGQGRFDNGRVINNVSICFNLYDGNVQATTWAFDINYDYNNIPPTAGQYEISDTQLTVGVWKRVCMQINASVDGRYLIDMWVKPRTTIGGQGIFLGNAVVSGKNAHSYYDTTAGSYSWNAYPIMQNWEVSIDINDSTKTAVDTTDKISQIEYDNGKSLFFNLTSSYSYNLELLSLPLSIQRSNIINFTYYNGSSWQKLFPIQDSTCGSLRPIVNSTNVSGFISKSCYYISGNTTIVQATAASLSTREYQIEYDNAFLTDIFVVNSTMQLNNRTCGYDGANNISCITNSVNKNISFSTYGNASCKLIFGQVNYTTSLALPCLSNGTYHVCNTSIFFLQGNTTAYISCKAGIYDYEMNSPNFVFGNVFNIEFDTNLPNATLINPSNGSYNNTNQNFSFSVNDSGTGLLNATLHIYNSSGESYQNSTILNKVTSATVGFVVNLVDGIYNWFVSVFDFAGNTFITSNKTVTIDTTYPLISFGDGTLIDNAYVNQRNIYMNTTWSELNPATITFWVDGVSHINSIPPSVYADNFTSQTEGVHTYYVELCDLAGNCNQTETRTITLDTIAPQINFSGNLISNNSIVNITMLVFDANTGTCWHSNKTNGNETITCSGNSSGNSSFIYYAIEGINNIYGYANDSAGNFNYTNFSFLVDTTSPQINFTSPTPYDGQIITTTNQIRINVTSNDTNFNRNVLNIRGKMNLTLNSSLSIASFVTTLTNGFYIINATTYDIAGNYNNTENRNFTINVITTNISISVGSPLEGASFVGSSVHLSAGYSGNQTPNVTMTFSLAGVGGAFSFSGDTDYALSPGSYAIIFCANDTITSSCTGPIGFNVQGTSVVTGGGGSTISGLTQQFYLQASNLTQTNQTLANLSFVTYDVMFDYPNIVTVRTYDTQNNPMDVETLAIGVPGHSSIISKGEMKRKDIGVYTQEITINQTNETAITFKVLASNKGIVIQKLFQTPIGQLDNFVKVSNTSREKLSSGIDLSINLLKDNIVYLLILVMIFGIIIVLARQK